MDKVKCRMACALGVCCLVLMAGNVALATANKGLQSELGLRQQYVQQSVQLEGLYREIARALAELGQRNNDNDVKAMLERHGISYQANVTSATSATSATPANPAAPRK